MKMMDIREILNKSIDKESGNIYILDQENHLLTGSHDDEIPTVVRDPKKMATLIKQDSFKTDEGTLRISTLDDPSLNLRYIALTNTSRALSSVQEVQNRFMGIMGVILAVGILLVVLTGISQYRPFRDLERRMEKQLGESDEENSLDDFVRIQQHVTTFLEQNKELHQEIRRQAPHAREQVLRKLLMGRFKESKEIDLLLESVDITLFSENYFVMVIDTKMMSTEASIQNQEFLMTFLDQIESKNFRAYGTELLFNQAIALFVSMNDHLSQK